MRDREIRNTRQRAVMDMTHEAVAAAPSDMVATVVVAMFDEADSFVIEVGCGARWGDDAGADAQFAKMVLDHVQKWASRTIAAAEGDA